MTRKPATVEYMSASLSSPMPRRRPPMVWQTARRLGPLGTIILLHIAFFYALQSGLLHRAVLALPREVSVAFITPEAAPAPATPQATPAPKAVPMLKKPSMPAAPPAHNAAPSPQAVTIPQAGSALAEPAAPAPAPAAPAVPAAPPAPAQPKTVTIGIAYVRVPQPEYPSVSRRMGEEGKAVLRVLVNEKGLPERAEIQQSSGSARLDEAARRAVLRALFKPFVEDGRPVPAYAVIPINFQLDN